MQTPLNYVFCASLFLFSKGAVVLGQAPGPNAIVLMNDQAQAMLNCTVAQMTSTQWTRTTDGINNLVTIASGCSIIGSNTDYYRTEQLGGNVCRLIIGNAIMQQAGVYACFDGSSTTYRSLVTFIDPLANVVVHNQPPEVVEGEQLNISCSVKYTGPSPPAPSLRPVPYFTTSPGQNFTSLTYYPSANIATVVATVRVQNHMVPIFLCYAVFEITGSTSGYNATPPADNITLGVTTELDVQCRPTCFFLPISKTPSSTPETESTATIIATASGLWFVLLLWLLIRITADIFLIDYQYGQCRDDYNVRYPFL